MGDPIWRFPVDLEIPQLATFPHLLGRTERAVPVISKSCHLAVSACELRVTPLAWTRSCRAAIDIPVALSASRGFLASSSGPGAIHIMRTPPGGKFNRNGTSVKETRRCPIKVSSARTKTSRIEQKYECWLDPERSVGTLKHRPLEVSIPSMSAFPIIAKQNSLSVGLFARLRKRKLGLDCHEQIFFFYTLLMQGRTRYRWQLFLIKI